ncbi:MAG: hypothetical protein HY645_13025 [Acidobacteria bacterium]|nr:hypothetical protein [Acidobacteriota bacterium]
MKNLLLLFFILTSFFPESHGSVPTELERAVAQYWDFLLKQNKNSALDLVTLDSRNDFILRKEPIFRSWKLLSVQMLSDREAMVQVALDRLMEGTPGHFIEFKVEEKWVLEEDQWKAKVAEASNKPLLQLFESAQTKAQSVPPVFRINPELLRIHFLDTSQRGVLFLENGVDTSAVLEQVELDASKFEILESPKEIAPGESARIIIHYKGEEISKDLKSEMTLVLKQKGERKRMSVPIVYNYLSPGARGLFGLTEEQVQKLKRGDKLTPVLKPTVPPQQPEQK